MAGCLVFAGGLDGRTAFRSYGERARKLSVEELQKLSPMVAEMKEAREQVKRYGDALE